MLLLGVFIAPALIQAQSKVSAETQPVSGGQSAMPGMGAHDHEAMAGGVSSTDTFFMEESSGTAVQPSAWPMPMVMKDTGSWNLLWMGQAFLVDTQQTGPFGYDKFYSSNWGMLGAMHRLGGGGVMLRTMLSLEPATVTERRYPLLFQTGETAFGNPITNAQHPHNFFMEISAQYSHSVGEHATAGLYYGVVGDPALGPVAYPHRASAMEIPQATLGHHWQDSTHIATNVLTGVLAFPMVRFEASGFYGTEPGENRWTIDFGPMNSYSGRITFTPTLAGRRKYRPDGLLIPRRWSPAMLSGPQPRWNMLFHARMGIVGDQPGLGPQLEDREPIRLECGACGDVGPDRRKELRERTLRMVTAR